MKEYTEQEENLLKVIDLHLKQSAPGESIRGSVENNVFEYFKEMIKFPEVTKKVLKELEKGHIFPRFIIEEHRKDRETIG